MAPGYSFHPELVDAFAEVRAEEAQARWDAMTMAEQFTVIRRSARAVAREEPIPADIVELQQMWEPDCLSWTQELELQQGLATRELVRDFWATQSDDRVRETWESYDALEREGILREHAIHIVTGSRNVEKFQHFERIWTPKERAQCEQYQGLHTRALEGDAQAYEALSAEGPELGAPTLDDEVSTQGTHYRKGPVTNRAQVNAFRRTLRRAGALDDMTASDTEVAAAIEEASRLTLAQAHDLGSSGRTVMDMACRYVQITQAAGLDAGGRGV